VRRLEEAALLELQRFYFRHRKVPMTEVEASRPRSPSHSHHSGKSAFTVLFGAMKSPAVWVVPMGLCALLLAVLYSQKTHLLESTKGNTRRL